MDVGRHRHRFPVRRHLPFYGICFAQAGDRDHIVAGKRRERRSKDGVIHIPDLEEIIRGAVRTLRLKEIIKCLCSVLGTRRIHLAIGTGGRDIGDIIFPGSLALDQSYIIPDRISLLLQLGIRLIIKC